MLEKYDEFKNKNKEINKKIAGLKKMKLLTKIEKFKKQQSEIQKRINNNYVNGFSNYN